MKKLINCGHFFRGLFFHDLCVDIFVQQFSIEECTNNRVLQFILTLHLLWQWISEVVSSTSEYHLIQNKEKIASFWVPANNTAFLSKDHQAYCFLIEWSSGGFYWKTLLKVITQMASSRVSKPSMWVRELTTVGPVWLHFWLTCLSSCSLLASHLL